jgi:hypothetical protein
MITKPSSAAEPSPSEQAGSVRPDKNLRSKLLEEIKTFLTMTIYLWVLFFLFSLHEAIVLSKYNINYTFFGLPLVNALVLAKVMLVAEDLHLGERFKQRPLVYPIAYKSAIFTAVFICFHVAEEAVIELFHGKSVSESLSSVGGGSLRGILSVAAIMAVALSPFFAFRELGRAIGERELRSLLFHPKSRPAQKAS